jgi:hypothetical protein
MLKWRSTGDGVAIELDTDWNRRESREQVRFWTVVPRRGRTDAQLASALITKVAQIAA